MAAEARLAPMVVSTGRAVDVSRERRSPEQRAGCEIFFGTHSSWGLGMAVDIQRNEIFHNPGRFGWTGGFGTTAYTDPAQGMIGILFTQRMMDSPQPPKVFTDFWTLAYGAMEIPHRPGPGAPLHRPLRSLRIAGRAALRHTQPTITGAKIVGARYQGSGGASSR